MPMRKVRKFKLKVSSELLAQRKINTKVNDKHIHYIEFKNTTEEQRSVANIIRHPIIG